MFSTPAAPERQRTPEDIASEPRPTHTAALAIPGERTGVAPELDERGFLKVGLPETANNHYFLFWLSGRALDSGRQKGEFKSLCLCCFAFSFCYTAVLLYCCTILKRRPMVFRPPNVTFFVSDFFWKTIFFLNRRRKEF